ncbi:MULTISPECIES: DUF6114 domain-containing protein [Streptomyces]|uniref:DUF6114 domain-containing protein n=1 Tax=Streptomyces TaxID=1883 RepID=UPI00163C97D2|nr:MULTISPECIES: DUF6114 domain-containing protein [Streptomyces]MBC2874007.1 hypothetical protein [Streptomyces sp. TYQ1024]UBI39057.1 DUF6114 domain-containing protein [Streptomyces mobaraensis]UKW31635.1 DUF6114 domain-containing protein [Streptomyces sp. TYQ1024]
MTSGTEARRHPWLAWRTWRKGRPFWGGLLSTLAGAEICAIPLGPLKIMLVQGITGILSILMGLVMIMMGLSAWFAPSYRMFAGIVTVMCAAAALVLSNLGGFLLGTLLGVIGGSMVFAWQPHQPQQPQQPPPDGPEDEPVEPFEPVEPLPGDPAAAPAPPAVPPAVPAPPAAPPRVPLRKVPHAPPLPPKEPQ